MNDILTTLFLDNPYIPDQVYTFCRQDPDFQAAERDFESFESKLRVLLDKENYEDFKETLYYFLARYARTYYLFGLGLRREVLSALEI